MKSTPSQILLRQHSRWRLFAKLAGLFLIVVCAISIRQLVIEGVRISDNALAPVYRNNSWVWVCKLNSCIDHAPAGSPLLFKTVKGQRLLRLKVAGPGTTLHGDTTGRVQAPGFQRILHNDSWFFEPTDIHVPKHGDSLNFAELKSADFDLAVRLYQQQLRNQNALPIHLIAHLFIDGRETTLDKAAITQIHNLPINVRDLPNYSWQEIRLIEMQILRNELGSLNVDIKRDVWQDKKLVKGFRVLEDCFFVLCLKGRDCVDSREIGYVSRSQISGSLAKWSLSQAKP